MNFECLLSAMGDIVIMDYPTELNETTASETPDSEAIRAAFDAIVSLMNESKTPDTPITPNSCITTIL